MRLHELLLASVVALAPLTAHGSDTQTRYRASFQHESQGKYAEALADIDGLAREQRSTYVYQLRRGWLLYLLARYWDSIEAYRAAIKLHPKAVEPRLGLMLPEMALLMWMDVLGTGKAALKLDPHNYLVNSRMAWANYNLGRYKQAEALYRKILIAYPSDVEMRVGLGWSLVKQGRYGTALAEFETVLEFAPDHASAQEGRTVSTEGA